MSRVFAYCRVSTADQTTDNQVKEITATGYQIEHQRIITETVSGSVYAMKRKGFIKLVERLEAGDVLIVTKLDRLGRNAMDVRTTVEGLAAQGVRVICLALGSMDLTSSAGKMTMQVIAAVAEFEKDLLVERTRAGLERTKAKGQKLGRPSSLSPDKQATAKSRYIKGESISQIARDLNTTRQTVLRLTSAMPLQN